MLLAEKPGNDIASVNSIIMRPVMVGIGVKIVNSIIGPNVSIADNTIVKNSIIADGIIGSGAKIVNMNLQTSILGDDVNLAGKPNSLNIGDSSTIEF